MSKLTKSLLKSAKQFIQDKDYEAALEKAKEVLALHDSNYNALVFAGLCHAELRHLDESLSVYRDAIAMQPEQTLAHQGLVNLYTKHWSEQLNDKQSCDLISSYKQLIRLSNSNKTRELEINLSKAYCSVGKLSEALQVLSESATKCQIEDLAAVHLQVVVCLELAMPHFSQLHRFSSLIFSSVQYVCEKQKNDTVDKEKVLKTLLIFLHSDEELLSEKLKDLVALLCSFAESGIAVPFVTECLMQINLQKSSLLDEEVDLVYEKLASNYGGSFNLVVDGYKMLEVKDLEAGVQLLSQGVALYPDYLPARLHLCQTLCRMRRWSQAEAESRSALQRCKVVQSLSRDSSWMIRILSLSSLRFDITFCFAASLCGSNQSESWKLSVATFEKLAKVWPGSIPVRVGMVEVYSKLKEWSAAKDLLQEVAQLNPDDPEYRSWKSYLMFLEEGSLSSLGDLEDVVQQHPSSFIAHLHLGIMMWNSSTTYREDKSKCLAVFLKAAKLDVYCAETFLYLGHYYREVALDWVRAIKCYEKAYKLCPGCDATGRALADLYMERGELDSALNIYETVTSSAPPGVCKWAWLRLGLCRMKQNETNAAIKCFQSMLRADPEDHICWECLGDGYLTRGSYTAAWKSFQRAHELSPTSVYSAYQMATIKQKLSQFSEAVKNYHDALTISADYVPALKGLGESHLSLARIMLTEGRDLTCVDHVNEAIKHLIKALSIKSELSCVWKLLGDCMTIIYPLHSDIVRLVVADNLVVSPDSNPISKVQALQIGGRCYLRALQLRPQATLWHDLGMNYFHQAKIQPSSALSSDFAAKAVKIIQRSILLHPSDHRLWNALGVMTSSKHAKNPALAQHSFIKSIQLEPNNARGWTNLGALYLEQGDVQLAHKAFRTAQCLEPDFVNCWIGQGLVAESVGSDKAMGLFRHATELGLHDQASIGYAAWVCNVMTECMDHDDVKYREHVRDLNGVSASITAMSKYCRRHPDKSWALSMYGFLLEQSSLNRSAEDAYKTALDLLLSRLDGSSKLDILIDRARFDYARVLRKNMKHPLSLRILQSSSSPPAFSNFIALAKSLFGLGRISEAASTLRQADEVATIHSERSHVRVAMAALLWKQGNVKKSRELLSNHASLESLQALCAIGILESDVCSLKPILHELLHHDVEKAQWNDVMYTNCLLLTMSVMTSLRDDDDMTNGKNQACRVIQKYMHRFPDNWQLRHFLSRFLRLVAAKRSVNMSLWNARSALLLYDVNPGRLMCDPMPTSCNHHDLMANHSMMTLVAGKHCDVSSGRRKPDSLRTAQRFVHCHPYSAESWFLLSGACYARDVYKRSRGCADGSMKTECDRIASFVASQSESPICEWAIKQNMMSCLGDFARVQQLSSQMESEDAASIVLLSKLAAFPPPAPDRVLAELEESARSSKIVMATMFAYHALSCLGKSQESYSLLKQVLENSFDRNCKLSILIRMTEVALEGATLDSSNRDEWCIRARDAIGDATKLSGDSHIVQLLQGLCHRRSGNYRKAVSWFHKVLDNPRPSADLCRSKSISARMLYKMYQEREDDRELEKLLKKCQQSPDPELTCVLASASS